MRSVKNGRPENRSARGSFSSRACVLLLEGLALILGACGQNKPSRPNILIITVDTLRADRVGCYGYAGGLTPNIDAMARDGIVFERAVAQVPLTWPSPAAIFTRTYPL